MAAAIVAVLAACRSTPTPEPIPAPEPTPAPAQPQPQPVPEARRPAATPDTALPVFEVGLWPGEGIPAFAAAGSRLVLRERPYGWATAIATLQTRPGDTIQYDLSRYQTIVPAAVTVLAATAIEGRSMGRVRLLTRDRYYSGETEVARVAVEPPARFDYLQYRAEGTCFVRVNGQVIDADPCPTQDAQAFRVTGEPKTLWWIRVSEPGRPAGWLLVEPSAVRLLERRF